MKIKLVLTAACIGLFVLAHAAPSPNTGTEPFRFVYDFAGNPGVTNFVLYYGTSPGVYTSQASSTTTNITVTGLNRNTTYYFAATAQDNNGLESDYSQEVAYTVPKKPGPPSQLTPL